VLQQVYTCGMRVELTVDSTVGSLLCFTHPHVYTCWRTLDRVELTVDVAAAAAQLPGKAVNQARIRLNHLGSYRVLFVQ
jgi:hypothetical protein